MRELTIVGRYETFVNSVTYAHKNVRMQSLRTETAVYEHS